MNKFSVSLITFAVGVAAGLLVVRFLCCEPTAPVFVEWQNAKFNSPTAANKADFLAAARKGLFLHHLQVSLPDESGTPTPEDRGIGNICLGCPGYNMIGHQVTQRVGFQDAKSAKDAMDVLAR